MIPFGIEYAAQELERIRMGRVAEESEMYVGSDGREYEDAELDNMREGGMPTYEELIQALDEIRRTIWDYIADEDADLGGLGDEAEKASLLIERAKEQRNG